MRRRRARAEFWVLSDSRAPLAADDLKREVGALPGELLVGGGLDPWTFSDVRFRMGDADPRSAREAIAAAPTEPARVTKIVFAGDVAAEGFPLATVTAAALAASRLLEASFVWDEVSGRGWLPAALAEACRRHGVLSPEVHLNAIESGESGVAQIRFRGFEKRGISDLASLPFPSDLQLVASEALRAYAAARWRGEEKEFAYEAYGDRFLFRERPARGGAAVRLYRLQAAR